MTSVETHGYGIGLKTSVHNRMIRYEGAFVDLWLIFLRFGPCVVVWCILVLFALAFAFDVFQAFMSNMSLFMAKRSVLNSLLPKKLLTYPHKS